MKFLLFIFVFIPYFCFADVSGSAIPDQAYTVQVFSSKDEAEAREYAVPFNKYNTTFLWPKDIKKQAWFRVCVGLFDKKTDAEEQLNKIKKDHPNSDAFVSNIISN